MSRKYTPPQAFETTTRPPITLSRVKSSQVAAVGYDPATRQLAIQFVNRSRADDADNGPAESPVYVYPDVSPETHANMLRAESIGVFFGTFIKPLAFKKYVAEPLPKDTK